MTASEPKPLVTVLRMLLAVVAGGLLMGFGGEGAFAAPVTLPLIWWATRPTSGRWRNIFVVLGSLTAFQAGYAIPLLISGANKVFSTGGAAKPQPQSSLLVSLMVGAIFAAVAMVILRRAGRQPEA